jgi:type I restriction enzyme S subunit
MEKKLGDVCTFYSGTGFPVKYQGKDYDELAFYKVGDIANNVLRGNTYLNVCDNYISMTEAKEMKGTIVPRDTVVFAKIGEALKLNRRAITSADCLIDNNVMGIAPDKKVLRIGYFFYYMLNVKMQNLAESTTVPSVRKSKLEEIIMEVPSMSEQEKIEKILDVTSSIILKRKKELTDFDDLIKARFVEMFGDIIHNDKHWDLRVFSEITDSRLGKMLDTKQQTGNYSFPYLANFNVQWFQFNLSNLNQMDFDEADQTEFKLKKGDLLVCEGGEIGRCAVWHDEIQPCYFQKALHRVRCNQEVILPDYLAWWFKYNCDHKGFASIEGAKATIAHLPGVKLKALLVAVPPLELQNQFAAFVAQVNKSKVAVQKALDETQSLFDSLMQEYFG